MKYSMWVTALSLALAFAYCKAGGITQKPHFGNDTIPKVVSLEHPTRLLLSNLRSNNYLKAHLILKNNEQAYMASRFKVNYMEAMTLMNYYIGEVAASVYWDSTFRKSGGINPVQTVPFSADTYVLQDAHHELEKVAKQEQVVMINEEHRFPQHRAFTNSLLQTFYNHGYRYFALETITAMDTLLNKRGYVTQKSGFYTADPVFASMVRNAISIGYKIVPYEWEEECISSNCDNEREKGQAKNLYERILKGDSKAKILVHVGRAHNAEVKENDSTAFMAWHFRELTKIDPFTIDQMYYNDNSGQEFQRPLYKLLTEKYNVNAPVVVLNSNSAYYKAGSYDLHILHPKTTYVHNRPAWLTQGRSFRKVNIKKLGLNKASDDAALIQAFTHPQDSLEVPLDQILFKKTRVQQLLLPKGHYYIRAVDSNNFVFGQYLLKN